MSLRGACNCGQVAFEAHAAGRDVYVCHCSICRRYSGSAGFAVVLVEKSAFRWVRGEADVRLWQKPDADWQAWFCGHCGSPVPGPNDATRMFIPAGLISEGGDQLRVAAHLFVDSRAGWDVIGGDADQYPAAFGTRA